MRCPRASCRALWTRANRSATPCCGLPATQTSAWPGQGGGRTSQPRSGSIAARIRSTAVPGLCPGPRKRRSNPTTCRSSQRSTWRINARAAVATFQSTFNGGSGLHLASIPYFAGRPLQLAQTRWTASRLDWPQSPTSRGGRCNPVLDRAPPVRRLASIPYFAGRPLQLRDERVLKALDRLLQSPTSRGGRCNPVASRTPSPRTRCFNPLLRGAAVATASVNSVSVAATGLLTGQSYARRAC
jgi:hypothetical protein